MVVNSNSHSFQAYLDMECFAQISQIFSFTIYKSGHKFQIQYNNVNL